MFSGWLAWSRAWPTSRADITHRRRIAGPKIGDPATAAHADQAGEREQLARLAHEIEALEALVDAAEAQAGYPARIRFQYAWLRQHRGNSYRLKEKL
ncbi:MAG: RAQPRD family integrative conjugative element protein [Gammaproteobacteria bacterium]